MTDLPATFTERLKDALTEHNLSSSELAKRADVSVATLSRILSGQVTPSFTNMAKIAHVLGLSLDELAGTNTPSPTGANGQELSPQNAIAATFLLENTTKTPEEAGQLLTSAARGTWVDCWTQDYVDVNLPKPTVWATRQSTALDGKRQQTHIQVDMLFPHDLVEKGSISGILSVIGSAVTGTGAKLVDLRIPEFLVRTFHGPTFGIRGLRDAANKHGRPLLSCTIRPMNGLSPKIYGKAVYEALAGGMDVTADPTMLHHTPGNHWRERFRFCAEAAHAATAETNEYKTHAANITAPTTDDMLERAAWAKDLDLGMVLLDTASVGWAATQTVANWCHNNEMILCAMGGRALNGDMFTEQLQAKLLRFAGADIISMGSPLRGDVDKRRFTKGILEAMRAENPLKTPETGQYFDQPTSGLARACPAVGGGHNPWHFPRLLDAMGDDCMIQCGGSVMGHKHGSRAGATAVRVALESCIQARNEGRNLSVDGRAILTRAMRYSPELKTALEQWQEGSFLFGVVHNFNHKPKTEESETPTTAPSPISTITPFLKPTKTDDEEE